MARMPKLGRRMMWAFLQLGSCVRFPAILVQPDWNEPESTRQGGVRDDRRYPQENLLAGHTRIEWSELVHSRNETLGERFESARRLSCFLPVCRRDSKAKKKAGEVQA